MESSNDPNKRMENVVLISFDSLRSDYIAQMSPDEAPNLCLMRDTGAFFKNTIVQAPFTIPSHACMLSGLYPAKTSVRDMHHKVPPDVPTIFNTLKEKGFRTISSSPTTLLTDRGFKGIDEHVPFRYGCWKKAIAERSSNRFFAFLHYWGTHTPYETRLPGLNPVDIALNLLRPIDKLETIRYLRCISGRLWLLRVKRIRAMMSKGNEKILPAIKRGYKDAIIKTDKFLGNVLKILEETGLAKQTLVVVTGDHGDSFSERGEINRAVGSRYEHGQFLYDDIIKVPFILFSRGQEFSKVFDAQVQEIDIVPTLLEALGVKYNGNLDGTSLWSENIVTKKEPEDTFTFSEAVRESLDMELRCVRSGSSKLICDYKNNTFELYDLKADPEEQNNLYPGDQYSEKEILLTKLQSFSQIDNTAGASYSESEQKQIEQTLHNLGYLD